jgi:hypothetical protein
MERILRISDADQLFADHPEVKESLYSLLETAIEHKKPLFAPGEVTGLDELLAFELLNTSPGERYEFNYNSLVTCRVVQQLAEKITGKPMPVGIEVALAYAAEFYLLLREPKPRTVWYFHLELEFDRYILIWLNQVHGIDVTEFLFTITEEMLDESIPIRHYAHSYASAFPYLNDDEKTSFETVTSLYRTEGKKDDAMTSLSDLAKENTGKAIALYEYAKANNGLALFKFYSLLQIGLYPTKEDHYFNEAVDTFILKPAEGIVALAWIPYNYEEHIKKAFELVGAFPADTADFKLFYPPFYCRLIENPLTPADIRSACFDRISELLTLDDSSLRHQLVWRLGLVEGYDLEKFKLVPQILELNPTFIKDIFARFKTAGLIFNMVRDVYIHAGPAVNFQLFTETFTDLHHNDPDGFELELLKLLTDDLALARLAGMEVLRSRYGGLYEVDFLKLDEQHQLRALETLLPHPQSIEELLPILLNLRFSPFDTVRSLLLSQLTDLIWAYDHHLIDMVTKQLDEKVATDAEFIRSINDAFTDYEAIKKQKEGILEFNPLLNQSLDHEDYLRIDHELRAESMKNAEQQSFFMQFTKTFGVIRGNAFKTEMSEDIVPMHTVSTSRLIDMRYYLNPDEYQWKFHQHMTSRNYPSEEGTE